MRVPANLSTLSSSEKKLQQADRRRHVLSVRTVENRLERVYEELGVPVGTI